MTGIRLDIVTVERAVYSDDVDMVIAPGVAGELGILRHHTPLMTTLQAGELRIIKKGKAEVPLAISGGFLEVRPDKIVVLADAAERADEIDIARAEEAKRRAQKRLAERRVSGVYDARAEAALHRSLARLKVAEAVRRRKR
ncbi:F0F1 ATP synthase subunit epsilon [Chloroflexota bacterium]